MNINQKCINELRLMSASVISNAKSGHTGSSVGAVPILFSLFKDHYFFSPTDSEFFARDRLVVSAGHISALYYCLLNLFEMGVSDEDLAKFRKLGSKTPGHPEYGKTKFVEVSTGPLGQGVANAVGMAIGQTMVAARYNAQKANIIDNYTYCFCGDGCLQEGVAMEACSLAGTLNLKKLILLYDSNNITIDGKVELANTEDIAKKFKAMNWNVIKVRNGNNYSCCTRAIARAKRANKPTIIIFNTTIGYGTSYAGTEKIHGIPLSDKELIEYKNDLLMPNFTKFSKEVKDYCFRSIRYNKIALEKWNRMYCLYGQTHPELCRQFEAFIDEKEIDILKLIKSDVLKEDMSGREANQLILKELMAKLPRFMGGTADLASSAKAYVKDAGDYSAKNRKGRNIHFGIREHAMGAICNGISLYLESPVFCSTFMSFVNYMLPPMRMSALMNVPVFYEFTHDSYKIGQDGPTHQPVEQLGQMRLIPNLNVYRPADTNELLHCYKMAFSNDSPSAFALSRQTLKNVTHGAKNILKGGYILSSNSKSDVALLASGSEVETALQVAQLLKEQGIKADVCSFPCLEVFDKQPPAYKNSVLNNAKVRVVIEASNDTTWYKYLTPNDLVLGINTFGESATKEELDRFYNFSPALITKKIKNLLKK
ncbi:MAG: transketolase [Clostridiales bacterium]|nr:transketolase [Clostridiales bacterium]